MMDYYSNFPGPSEEEAIVELKRNLKPTLIAETNAPATLAADIDRLIDESISEGVKERWPSGAQGSATGWAVFGRGECEAATRRILAQKILNFKQSLKGKTQMKLTLGETMPGERGHDYLVQKIGSYLGGKRRRKSRRRRRKRKSNRRKTKRRRKTKKKRKSRRK